MSSEILRQAAGVDQGSASGESAGLERGGRQRVRGVPRAKADALRAPRLQTVLRRALRRGDLSREHQPLPTNPFPGFAKVRAS